MLGVWNSKGMGMLSLVAVLTLTQSAQAPVRESLIDQVVRLTNVERVKAGVRPLNNNSLLESMAAYLASELVIMGQLVHADRQGRDLVSRAGMVRYPYVAIGENIAQGQRTAEEVVKAWMDSRGHRANLLSPDFREIGVGQAVHQRQGRFWVQIFGSR